MWAISWPRTALRSGSLIRSMIPVETATRERDWVGPVANAFGSGERKMPTSGIVLSPALFARACTVSTSFFSEGFCVAGSITFTPIIHFAITRERQSEMNAPPMPQTRQKIRSDLTSNPWAWRKGRTLRRFKTIDIMTTTKRFSAKKRKIRFAIPIKCTLFPSIKIA